MIGTNRRSHQRFPVLAAVALLAACSGGGGSGFNLAPTIVTAAFVGGAMPAAGDELLLAFSEDVVLANAPLTDADFVLSGSATLGALSIPPVAVTARTISITLGAGVSFVPDTTQISLSTNNDCIRDAAGAPGTGGDPVTIGTSDGASPTLGNITVANIDDALNGSGSAGGILQVPPNEWTIDLQYSDNLAVAVSRTQLTATVPVTTPAGVASAGTNLFPFVTVVSSDTQRARLLVPTTMSFPALLFTLSAVVIDASGLASAPATIVLTSRAFTDALRPFETSANAGQVWFLDFSRDVESFTTSAIAGGVSVDVVNGSNGRSDFEDVLHVLGLQSATPIPGVGGGSNDSNQVAANTLKARLLSNLALLFSDTKISFTTTQPSGSFGSSSSVAYASLGYSQIAIAGSATTAGVLGVAIFDPSNTTQNDDTRLDFSGVRLGVFLHTIADAGMGPPGSSVFRLTFAPLAPSLGGTPIGNDAQDGLRLLGTLTDSRANQIETALADIARFIAVIVAHECGHSMGLVRDGAPPAGLFGGDATNFPGSQTGHIRTSALFPSGATNVMSPSLSYTTAINSATGFNTLNLAYLREQVFYGN